MDNEKMKISPKSEIVHLRLRNVAEYVNFFHMSHILEPTRGKV